MKKNWPPFLPMKFEARGLEPEWHDVAPGRPDVCVRADLGASDEMPLLTGHLDTVGAAVVITQIGRGYFAGTTS